MTPRVKRALIVSAIVLVIFFLALRWRDVSGSLDPEIESSIRGGKRPKVDAQGNPIKQGFSSKTSKPRRPGNMKGEPIRDQLAYQFPYDVSNKFPAFIWQTWKYTAADPRFRDGYRPLEASWTMAHPEFIHEVVTDRVALYLIKHLYGSVPAVIEAYISLPTPVLKADFFRYLILLARGGIYSDIDTAALKPAPQWIPSNFRMDSIGLVIGIEADPTGEWKKSYSRRLQFCQWTIQSKPGHPVLREVVARITEKTLRLKGNNRRVKVDRNDVIEFTGPAAWTDTIFDYFNDDGYFVVQPDNPPVDWKNFTRMKDPRKLGDVVVLPVTSFSPGVGLFDAGEDDDPQAYVKHLFEGTWKPEKERHVGENDDNKNQRLKQEADQRRRLRKLGMKEA
ncbi:membrane-bound alpha-1,6- mannosyltransferase Initiation-specific [Orbilia ellipsospora]|uniref:Membrane-bound alpha-1,6- mannosyltransferase Initiation-specific n=1 Tax=Orbilia ellipsospora TaxID=2528407 RepID=A0AAV9WTR3_9PEZI